MWGYQVRIERLVMAGIAWFVGVPLGVCLIVVAFTVPVWWLYPLAFGAAFMGVVALCWFSWVGWQLVRGRWP